MRLPLGHLFLTISLLCAPAMGFAASQQEFTDLKKEVEGLRARMGNNPAAAASTTASGPIGRADAAIENKYGPNAPATTKQGIMTLGGLVQVWWYTIQNDNLDYYAPNVLLKGPNEVFDNDSFRIRRAELRLNLDITEDINAVFMFDPAGGDEANTFPGMPTNQGVIGKGFVGGGPEVGLDDLRQFFALQEAESALQNGLVTRRNMQEGFMKPNRVVQDAYINFHPPWLKNHDITVGQFKPPSGEEAYRNSGQLDFVERAMINQFGNQRDLGAMVHGSWWDNRFQYWLGAFDSAGSFQSTFASYQNRSDDNDAKDIAWRIMIRPQWDAEKWAGRLEVGYARQDGYHGEAGRGTTINDDGDAVIPQVDGLSLAAGPANRNGAWLWYRPGGPVKGWWLRGEWMSVTDRALPNTVGSFIALQFGPHIFRRQGWYFSTGYRLSDSIWAEGLQACDAGTWSGKLKKALYDTEFTFRYEVFGNIITDDVGTIPDSANKTDVFKTQVWTAGINYYWKRYNVRTQANFLWVDEPQGHFADGIQDGDGSNRIREVKNNVFIINQQVQW